MGKNNRDFKVKKSLYLEDSFEDDFRKEALQCERKRARVNKRIRAELPK